MQQNSTVLQPYCGYSLVWLLDAIVRDRLSRKASTSSVIGICKSLATSSIVPKLGATFILNHSDHCLISTPVISLKSLYDKVKNSFLVIGASVFTLRECIALKLVKKPVILLRNVIRFSISQTTKHLGKQVLAAITNYQPVRSRYSTQEYYFTRKHYEYSTKSGWRSLPPSHCIVPFKRRGGAVMTEQISYLSQIQAGREGFVYLIHAEGTSRYKIGRSVNPISRMSDIQKQAPYPLKIVKSFWTLDAIADEAYLHKCYAEYRVFGEWFELGGLASGSAGDLSCSRLWQVKEAFYRGSLTMWKVAEDAITHLCEQLGIQEEYFQESTSFHDVYGSLNSRESVILTENFVRSTLHDLILGSNFCLGHDESVVDRKPSDKLQGFLLGCLISFVTLSLGRGRVQS